MWPARAKQTTTTFETFIFTSCQKVTALAVFATRRHDRLDFG